MSKAIAWVQKYDCKRITLMNTQKAGGLAENRLLLSSKSSYEQTCDFYCNCEIETNPFVISSFFFPVKLSIKLR